MMMTRAQIQCEIYCMITDLLNENKRLESEIAANKAKIEALRAVLDFIDDPATRGKE